MKMEFLAVVTPPPAIYQGLKMNKTNASPRYIIYELWKMHPFNLVCSEIEVS